MKKSIISLLSLTFAIVACDPVEEDNSWNGNSMSEEVLANGIVLQQFDYNEETGEYTSASDGNYIKYATNPSKVVEIYYIVDGAETSLISGRANGIFVLAPSRGSNPTQTVYFRTKEFDGSYVTASKQITVKVATELTREMAIICSNAGSKTWKWNFDGKAVWGNFGYTASTGENFAANQEGVWWGVTTSGPSVDGLDGFDNQQAHRGKDKITGDEDDQCSMVFNENGTVKCYDKDGNEIRSAKFQIKDYDPINKHKVNDVAWYEGKLVVKGENGGILWPYAINTEGVIPEEYEIISLTANELVLSYAADGTGSWSEATFWRFKSDSDSEGNVAGYDKTGTDWTWDTDFGAVWGNCGYRAGDDWSSTNQGQWWGITTDGPTGDGLDGFDNQQVHRGGDKITGDDSFDAKMTFFPDGQIKSFDKDGNEIRSGKWSIGTATVNGKETMTLNTTAGSILWPYAINTEGYMPEQFELVYLSADKMALVYAQDGTGDWSEATFWRFKAKK